MAVPWAQIVRLMPSILEVSHELLKRTRALPRPAAAPAEDRTGGRPELEARIAALEENERRQAELVTRVADQLDQLTRAVTALHRQTMTLLVTQIVIALGAAAALVLALHR
ncbi:MAG: hypothetical protein ACREUT_06565 [Steroidobacteraceae bacterium]